MARELMTDEEWAVFAPFLIENRSRGGRPPADHRRVLDAVFWIARTGAPWRDLPPEFGAWNSVFRQFRRWTEAAVWDVILAALTESEASDVAMQMIDSTIVRAHQHAARECPIFCVRVSRSMLRDKDGVDHGEEDRRCGSGRSAEGRRAA